MHPTWMSAAVLVAAAAAGPAVAQGQLEWFQADRLQVRVGEAVNVGAGWRIDGSFSSGGGSNLQEPAPVEGWQEWVANWYSTETVSPLSVDLQLAGNWSGETFSGTGGQGISGTAGASVVFDQPGWHTLEVSGSWQVRSLSTQQAEVASRTCWNSGDPDGGVQLFCDSWSWSYPVSESSSDWGGSLGSLSLQIEVLAVPEPATTALWGGGLLALAGLAARRRQATATGTRRASAHISS